MKRRSSSHCQVSPTPILSTAPSLSSQLHSPPNSCSCWCVEHIIHTVTEHSYSIPLTTLQLKRRSSATLPGATHAFTKLFSSSPLPPPVAEGGLKRRSPSNLEHIIHTVSHEHSYFTPLPTLQLKRRSSSALPGVIQTPSQSYSTALPPPVAEGGLKRRSPSTLKHIIHTVT